MTITTRPLAEVTAHAIRVLTEEIGVADTARFLQQFGGIRDGNYTESRRALVEAVTLDDIFGTDHPSTGGFRETT